MGKNEAVAGNVNGGPINWRPAMFDFIPPLDLVSALIIIGMPALTIGFISGVLSCNVSWRQLFKKGGLNGPTQRSIGPAASGLECCQ